MSNVLTKQDREEVARVLSRYGPDRFGLFWEGFINRWEAKSHSLSEGILTSLKRQANIRKKLRPNWKYSHGIGGHLEILFLRVSRLVYEMNQPPLRPKVRQEVIDRIVANSKEIIRDMVEIGLPTTSTSYFTNSEISARYQTLLPVLGLSKIVDESLSFDYDAAIEAFNDCHKNNRDLNELERFPSLCNLNDVKSTIEHEEEDRFQAIDLEVTEVLAKLTDENLLDSLAKPADVSKIDSQNYQRIFMIRKLTQEFMHQYGEGLQETTGRICALIFDDESIDRDTVRSALSGFSPRQNYKQIDFTAPLRIAVILGKVEERLLQNYLRNGGIKTD